MTKQRIWIMLSALLIALLVACSSPTPTPQPTAAPATSAAATTAPTQDVTLRWRTRPDNQAEIDVYSNVSRELSTTLPGIELVYEAGGSETSSYQDVLKTELAAGTAPDVFWIPGTDVADFAKRGLIMNLRSMADGSAGYSDDAFYPGPMFHLTFNPTTGKTGEALWGLPRDVSTFALYLNLDLLAESGAPDPRELAAAGNWNWDTFVEVATAMDALGDDIYGYGQNAWWGPYGYWLNAAGGGFFNADRTACNLTSPESLAGLAFESRIYNEFNIAVPYGEDSEPPFLAGKVGMFQNGRWATPGVRSSANFNWDVVELPDGPAGPSNWLFWGAYVVSANTKYPEQAWQLVQALTTAETQGKVAALGANIPSRVSQAALDAFLTFTPPANNQAFLNGLARNPATEGPLWAGNWPAFDSIMGPAVQSVLTGQTTIEQFAATVCDEANKTFDTVPVVAPPAAQDVTLRWRTRPDNQAEIDVYSGVSKELSTTLPGIELVYEAGGSETSSYQDVLKTELAAGTAPDVFWIPGTDVADFAKRGLIMNLRSMADGSAGYSDDAFYPGPMFHLTFDPAAGAAGGALWGLPRDVSTFALYLNLDLLAESGAPDPRELAAAGNWNWDTFVEVATAMDALGDDIYGYGQNAWWGPYGYWLNAAGGGFFNADRTACNLASPESLAGLAFESRIYNEFNIAVPYGEDSEPPFLAGKVGMFQNGRWATPGVRSSANFNWDVVELPDGPAGPSNWLFWGAYVVNANTKYPEQAWQLVQALTTAETQGKVAALGANIPSRVSQAALDAFLTFTPPANNQAFLNGLARNPATEGPLWAGNWPAFDSIMGPAVQSVLTGQLSIDQFAATVCVEADKTFDR